MHVGVWSHAVADFDPDSVVSMRVALKLEYCANIKVFERLQSKLSMLNERAGFSMTRKPNRMKNVGVSLPWSYEFMYSNPAAMCIISWVEDPSPSLRPTWKNFLQILREPGINLCDLADQIEQVLEFSKHPQTTEAPNCKQIF